MTRLIDADAFWASVVQSRKETIIDDDVKISMGEFVELLDNAPTVNFPIVHVRLTHPRLREMDAWFDKQRQLLFVDWITVEMAQKYNWTWEEEDNERKN